jgi:hypothetical protein
VEAALAWRTKAFLIVGIPCLLLVIAGDSLARVISEDSDPDLLTWGLWGLIALQSIAMGVVLFGRTQVVKMRDRMASRKGTVSLEDMGKSLGVDPNQWTHLL